MSLIRNVSPGDAVRRPLTARSLIASMLLGLDPPQISGQFLVRSNELFGVSEGTTRTALSRMTASGDLENVDGTYRLGAELRARRQRQALSRRAARLDWDGSWVLAIVDQPRRSAAARAELREAAKRLHLAEWREGVWCRPANLDPDRLPDSARVVTAQCTWVTDARPTDLPTAAFELDRWSTTADRLVDQLVPLAKELEAPAPAPSLLADGFVLSADVIRHLGADPLLPETLLAPSWPGDALRASFEAFEAAFRRAHRSWFVGSVAAGE